MQLKLNWFIYVILRSEITAKDLGMKTSVVTKYREDYNRRK